MVARRRGWQTILTCGLVVLVVVECAGWLPEVLGLPRVLGVNMGDPVAMLLLGLSVGIFLGLGLYQWQRVLLLRSIAREAPAVPAAAPASVTAWKEDLFEAGDLDEVVPDTQTGDDSGHEVAEPWERPADWWRKD